MSLAAEESYVTNVYENILFLSPGNIASSSTQSAIDSWASMINAGQLTEGQVATDVADSAEAASTVLPIVLLYEGLFARTPDIGGLANWVQDIDAGVSLNTVAQDFVTSSEFISIYGAHPSVDSFVTALYTNVLGRAPDLAGFDYWVAALGGANATPTAAQMAAVVLGFTQSSESLADWTANVQNWLVAGAGGTYPVTIGPGYMLTNGGAAAATEGSTVTFDAATTNVAPGSTLNYVVSGVTAAEIVGGQLTGTVTVAANGTAAIPVTLNSAAGEGLSGNLTVSLSVPTNTAASSHSVTSAAVPLTETTVGAPVYVVSGAINGGGPTATEGSLVTFTVATTNVAPGSNVNYALSGVTAAEVVGAQLTGTVTVGANGIATIPVTLNGTPGEGLAGNLTATITVPPTAAISSVTAASVPLAETPVGVPLYTVTASINGGATSATEGSVVAFNVATANVTPGSTLNYTLSGVTAGEVVGGQLTGTATVAANGTATIPVALNSAAGEGLSGSLTATLTALPSNASSQSVTAASAPLTETGLGLAYVDTSTGPAVLTDTTTDPGGLTIGNAAGPSASEPTGAITATDNAATGAVAVFGGAADTITTSSTGGVTVGTAAGTPGTEPTGGVTATDYAGTGAVNIDGGAAATVTTFSTGGVTIGTAAATAGTEPTGGETVTDNATIGALDLYGGAAVTVTSAGSGPINVGVAGTPAADPTGNVTITNLVTNPTTGAVTFGTAPATVYTDNANASGGATVTVTGTSADTIADASGTSTAAHLANVTLDGVGGATTITTGYNPLISLSVLDAPAASSDTVLGSAGHTLALVVGTTAFSSLPTTANVTDATATNITVDYSGTLTANLNLTAVDATAITLNTHTGSDSILVGTEAAGATAPSAVITGAVVGDALRFADAATTTVQLTAPTATNVAAAANLAAAVAIVDALASTTAHSVTPFVYGGNTYVLESVATGTGTLHAGDSLIELVGVHTLAAPASGVFSLTS